MHILKMIPFSVLCAGIFMSPAWSASAQDIRYVVIDPGHTPLKYGATGASGTVEFDYNTRFSHELAEALEKEQIPFIFSNAAFTCDTKLGVVQASIADLTFSIRSSLSIMSSLLQGLPMHLLPIRDVCSHDPGAQLRRFACRMSSSGQHRFR